MRIIRFILVIGFLLALPMAVFADGMVVKPDPYADRWDYVAEHEQQAFIKYQDGNEILILGIDIDHVSSRALWLFPVPAAPDVITADLISAVPSFRGEELSDAARSNLDNYRTSAMYPNIYAWPMMIFVVGSTSDLASVGSTGESVSDGPSQEVTVHKEITKGGVTTQVITPDNTAALYQYLSQKGLNISRGSISQLDGYIGQDYSFIASWLSPTTGVETDTQTRGVQVEFPTDQLYFPLVPTSVYGPQVVPATIRVLGHVKPSVYDGIEEYTTVEYYAIEGRRHVYIDPILAEESYRSPMGEATEKAREIGRITSEFSGTGDNIDLVPYTKITISAPSRLLTQDLWMERQAPVQTYIPMFFVGQERATILLIIILSSILVSLIAGRIIFNNFQGRIPGLLVIAAANVFTIISVGIVTALMRTKTDNPAAKEALETLRQKRYFAKRRFAMIAFAIGGPLAFIGLVIVPISMKSIQQGYGTIGDWVSIIVIFAAAIAFLIAFWLKRIKKTDKAIFEVLKKNQHSSWTGLPQDGRKASFVILFSILYFFAVWAVVAVLKIIA